MVVEQLTTILKKEKSKELIPFLKSLDSQGKKEIAAALKSLAKEYLDYRMEGSTYKQKASPSQGEILYATAFVCLNRKEYTKFDSFGQTVGNSFVSDILPWYCPDWFSDAINDLTKREWMPWHLNYKHLMDLTQGGYVSPKDELIVRLLPQLIFDRDEKYKFHYSPKNLERLSVTLEQHIWLIFQFESDIHFSDRYHHFENSNKNVRHWMEALKFYMLAGKLDRHRLLKESLLATERNFNKALSGWFVDLFEFMEPTHKELLSLQGELANTLSSQHSKAVNAALNGIKKIIEEKEFNLSAFLENSQILLSSDTKSVVASTLGLLEKVLRKNPGVKEDVCISICQAFIHNDESIQTRAAKLLLKYHDEARESITAEIGKYSDSMSANSRKLLGEFINSDHQSPDPVVVTSPTVIERIEPIKEVTTLDEVIFLASQAFDNNDPLHIDLLPAALINLHHQLTGSNLVKLEPALQRAYKIVTGDFPSTMGFLDHLLATFFIDYTKLLIERSPTEASSLGSIHDSFKKNEEEKKAKWSGYTSNISSITTWSVHSRDTTYIIHKAIVLEAYEKIKREDYLPMLSTPTHQYGYVDPLALVSRLSRYQQANVIPDNYDFQLALSRLASFNRTEALKEAKHVLKDESLRIIEFVLEKDANPVPPYTTPAVWFMAGISKSTRKVYSEFSSFFYATIPRTTITGDVPWRSFVEGYQTSRYNFEKKAQEQLHEQRQVLRLELNPSPKIWVEVDEKKGNVLAKLKKLVSPKKTGRPEVYLIYECLSLKGNFLSAEHNDVQRFIYLFPSNPNPILALVASRALTYSTFSSETDKRLVIKTLEALINIEFDYSEITHLFVATCMLTSDKTVRSFAAELWINGVSRNNVDSSRIGQIIGTHTSGEYAPLKRFTDLISSNLLKISRAHDLQLETLLTSVIERSPDEAPVGTKRLLELYSEVLSLNNTSVSSDLARQKLDTWSAVSGLKKVISSLR